MTLIVVAALSAPYSRQLLAGLRRSVVRHQPRYGLLPRPRRRGRRCPHERRRLLGAPAEEGPGRNGWYLAAEGLTWYPFRTKWTGFDFWFGHLGTILAWLSAAGLLIFATTRTGRFLLVLLLASLVPYAFTWTIPEAENGGSPCARLPVLPAGGGTGDSKPCSGGAPARRARLPPWAARWRHPVWAWTVARVTCAQAKNLASYANGSGGWIRTRLKSGWSGFSSQLDSSGASAEAHQNRLAPPACEAIADRGKLHRRRCLTPGGRQAAGTDAHT